MEPATLDARRCPACGFHAEHPPAIRQGRIFHQLLGREVGVVDVGWQCRRCDHEWGFEVLKEESDA